MTSVKFPAQQGLYCPDFEHDSCGVGFLAHLKGDRSHKLVQDGLLALRNLNHRGACGCEENTGDGAGILLQIPDKFFRAICGDAGMTLPVEGKYGVGVLFAPTDPTQLASIKEITNKLVESEGLEVIGWRDVPADPDLADIGDTARAAEPTILHVFVGDLGMIDQDAFERKLYVVRRLFEKEIDSAQYDKDVCYYPSFSSRTIVYKGMLTPDQLGDYFPDLSDSRVESALAMVHSRFSTNTFPSWKLSHPYRMISHNGEINTVRGNTNWMKAREALFDSPLFDDIAKIIPVIDEAGSDTAVLDNALELLVQAGWPLAHAMMMLIPEAWSGHESMPQEKIDFYQYHSTVMEPWDGPASVAFTDGKTIGAVLDRNGLRPSRYIVTKDDLVLMASEVGVLPIEPDRILLKGRLEPGKMFLVSLEEQRIIDDSELKLGLATSKPYSEWNREHLHEVESLPEGTPRPTISNDDLLKQQLAFGYSIEDLKYILGPMMSRGEESIGSMGTDTPLAVLSDEHNLLYNYFQQLFA